MIVSEEVMSSVTYPMPGNWRGLRRSQFRGTLDAFTRGDTISVAEKPFKKPSDAFFARTHPVSDEIWDIRSSGTKPGIRCLGAFGGKDFFIALIWDYRENICGGKEWRDEVERCKMEWANLFGRIPRYCKGSLDGYLTKYYAV